MAINFPSNPSDGDLYSYEDITYSWSASDGLWVSWGGSYGTGLKHKDSFTGSGSTTSYALTYEPLSQESVSVYFSGVYQNDSNYSLAGQIVTFTTAPPANTDVEIVYIYKANVVTDDLTVTGNISAAEATFSGNVGIGTDLPYSKLHIVGLDQTNGTMSLTADAAKGSFESYVHYGAYGDWYIRSASGSGNVILQDTGGNVLVGTTSAVVGGGPLQVKSKTGSENVATFQNGVSDSGFGINFLSVAGSGVGSIAWTGSATNYNTSSDYRLKTDVQAMTGASARVQALKPVNFEWLADGSRTDGFLAHELQAVVPEAATGTKDAVDEDGNPEYQGIDQSKLVPLLTAALQEALARIEALEAKA